MPLIGTLAPNIEYMPSQKSLLVRRKERIEKTTKTCVVWCV
jgi:hypothetical protein